MKENFKNILIVILVIGIGFISKCSYDSNQELKEDKIESNNLIKALTDSTTFYKNKFGEVVAEKKSIQIDLDDLNDLNIELTDNQKNLIKRINSLDKDKEVITAALVKAQFIIDSLKGNTIVVIDTLNNKITFSEKTPFMDYSITAFNVKPNGSIKPELMFNKFNIPNEQFITFNWDKKDKKNKYPVSFNISNSNPYYIINNIDSYAIPELKKEDVKPTFWSKTKDFFKKSGSTIGKVGIGVAIGVGLTLL